MKSIGREREVADRDSAENEAMMGHPEFNLPVGGTSMDQLGDEDHAAGPDSSNDGEFGVGGPVALLYTARTLRMMPPRLRQHLYPC